MCYLLSSHFFLLALRLLGNSKDFKTKKEYADYTFKETSSQ